MQSTSYRVTIPVKKPAKPINALTTAELFEELERRPEVEKVKVGLYQPYDIKPKFGAPKITTRTLLLMKD